MEAECIALRPYVPMDDQRLASGIKPSTRRSYGYALVDIGCPRIIRTLYFDVLKEGQNNFTFRLYSAAWST